MLTILFATTITHLLQRPACMVILCSHHTGSTGIQEGRYKYTGDLLALERMSMKSEPETPGRATVAVSGFLPLQVWSPYLRSHPDADFAGFTRRGLSQGFQIDFDYQHPLRPNPGNFHSVKDGGPVYLQQSSCRTSGGLNESCHTPEPHRDYSQATPVWQVPFNCGPVSTT